MHPVPISRSRGPSAARQWRFARADRAHWGPKREGQKKLGSRRRLRDRALCLSKRRPGPSSLTTSAPPLPPCLSLSPEPKTPQARRAAVVRISALAQRAEYIWFDGLEGAPEKVRCFVFSFFSPHFPFERESREREEKRRGKKKERPENPHPRPLKKEKEKKKPAAPPQTKTAGHRLQRDALQDQGHPEARDQRQPQGLPRLVLRRLVDGAGRGQQLGLHPQPGRGLPGPRARRAGRACDVRGAQPGLDAALDEHEGGAGGAHRRRGAFFSFPRNLFARSGFFRRVLLFLLSPSAPPLPCLLSSFSFPPPLSLPVRSSPRPRSTASSRSTPCSPTRATSTAGRRGVTPPPRARSTAAWARRPCTAGRSPRRTW